MEHLILTRTEFFRQINNDGDRMYVRKALAFVRKILKHISMPHNQVPPLSPIPSKEQSWK